MSDATAEQINLVSLTSDLVSAYLTNNHVQVGDLPGLIYGVHTKLTELAGTDSKSSEPEPVRKLTPAEIKRSILPDHLLSFEDGKPYKTLRRHLTLRGLSPEEYRAKWGLPSNYPMTSANYSAQRSKLAQSIGLGRRRSATSGEDQA